MTLIAAQIGIRERRDCGAGFVAIPNVSSGVLIVLIR
jgi:hypothetical protein